MLLRLLIVDDDTSLCGSLKSFFERHKYKVETANDGLSAVKVVETFRPNLMFLDIGLPGISGIEVLKQVKDKDPSVRVIMITGQTEDELVRQARVLGADDYVTKPFTLEYLSGEVLDKLHKQLFYELRSASADLAIEREKVEVVFDQVADGVIMFDAQGMIFVANPVARTLLGLKGDVSILNAQKAFEHFKGEVLSISFAELDRLAGKSFDVVREEPKKLYLNVRINPIRFSFDGAEAFYLARDFNKNLGPADKEFRIIQAFCSLFYQFLFNPPHPAFPLLPCQCYHNFYVLIFKLFPLIIVYYVFFCPCAVKQNNFIGKFFVYDIFYYASERNNAASA